MSEDRIRALRRVSRPTPEGGWITLEAEHETARPQGVTVEDALRLEFENLEKVVPEPEPGPVKPAEQPKTSMNPAQLDKLPWQPMKKNPAAQWIFDNIPEASLLVQRLRETKEIILSGWKYQLSIPSGQEKGFVNRFPQKG